MAGTAKKVFKWVGLGLAGLVTLAVLFGLQTWYGRPIVANWYYDRIFIEFALDSPQTLTNIGIFKPLEDLGLIEYSSEWDDDSQEKQEEDYQELFEIKETVLEYDDEGLSESERLSKKILLNFLDEQISQYDFRFHNYPVNQLFGLQNNIPRFLDTFHAVNSVDDAEAYIARLSKIDTKLEQNMEGLLIRENMGIIPPTFVIDKSLEIMQNFVDQPATENVLYVSFKNKLEGAEEIGEEERDRLLAEAEAEVNNTVYPAYQGYIDYFTALRAKSNTDAGVWKFPNGREYYNLKLKEYTTTDMTADEIHAIGLTEVDRIQAEIVTILEGEGYDTSLGFTTLITQMAEEERFYYPDTDEGRAQILEDYAVMIDEIEAGMDDAFNIRPTADVEVRRVPEFSEKTAPGAYYNTPALDGSRPGIFYANLYDIKATPKYGMRTLAYHEAVPGHHFQLAIQQELEGLPIFRGILGFTAYNEGWALYSERVAWELGFQEDPYSNIGRLQAELFRAVRLVVDTGLHAQRWTREQAIEYMSANTGIAESDVVSEIERYIVLPGQATAYKVGMMEIQRLREEAKAALGDKFDLRDFHDVVLKNGSVPLTVLRELVMEYIAEKQAA